MHTDRSRHLQLGSMSADLSMAFKDTSKKGGLVIQRRKGDSAIFFWFGHRVMKLQEKRMASRRFQRGTNSSHCLFVKGEGNISCDFEVFKLSYWGNREPRRIARREDVFILEDGEFKILGGALARWLHLLEHRSKRLWF